MTYPQRFSGLPEYAFPRLRRLLGDLEPGDSPIQMTIGDPRHAPPAFVAEEVARHADAFMSYPPNDGAPELLSAISGWLDRRYGWAADPETDILALNGTREGLYNAAMALCPETKNGARPVILTPNPFYQVYAVAALAVEADPVYIDATAATGHLPDFAALDPATLDRTAIAYICSPANPQGATASMAWWSDLLALAERHDFLVFADECYSEIYTSAPPTGILDAVRATGTDPNRVVAFHSLSKRSNLAGMRSGFAVSGAENIARMKQLRNYAGAPLPVPLQMAAARAWGDEAHVEANRRLYAAKFDAARDILGNAAEIPEAGFFLWLPVPKTIGDGVAATIKLWTETGVKVLPGAYLARETDGTNPGDPYIRAALVAPLDETVTGLTRLAACLYDKRS
ncbi:aminotransferase class I/II-fold pyridoxal phosphate-dependent enzyme [uncultured Jannaschia sp.]|uniref:aminotransferase class I/II-fold pyridoxal phosphate-dependent enzyme n=1 Tax=uncultured Jannaschia sp. TaxID=293347 RepID=UPI002638A0A6|nr:aminotransferase class I/II-fold pyridoxal phosphate-dependent enzyme [uncultured Jannaschia sp.]